MRKAQRNWITPEGKSFVIYGNIMEQPHLLVAGATGSGKSVVINGIITTALFEAPSQVQFILIDPKRVEVIEFPFLLACFPVPVLPVVPGGQRTLLLLPALPRHK